MRNGRWAWLAGLALAVGLTVAACGSDSSEESAGSATVGSADFGEARIIAEMYAQVLEADGYEVTRKLGVGSREVYIKAMENGEIDLVPEYLGTLTEFFNTQVNGSDAAETAPLASSDPDQTMDNLQPLAQQQGFTVTSYSAAVDQNAFAVTRETAEANDFVNTSDLASANGTLVLGGPPECPERPFCLPGLEDVYGLTFKEFRPLDAGGPNTKGALVDGTIDVGLVFSSDGAVVANDFVILVDDKRLQKADNIVGLARTDSADETVLAAMDSVNQVLTTEDLQELNKRFDVDKESADALAEEYLTDKNLI